MRGIKHYILLLTFLITACSSPQQELGAITASDSLTAQVKHMVAEKKKLEKLKDQLSHSRYMRPLLKYKPVIKKYAKRYGFDWRLIVAQIMQESRFREGARSPVGARGLMQLMPRTAREISRELDIEYILKNPRENIAAGIYHMRKQYNVFKNADFNNRIKLSLASYNCGVGRVYDAQDIARYYNQSPNEWIYVRSYISRLKSTDWNLHLQVWPQGKPRYGYFYGYEETINYVDHIWELYSMYKKLM